MDLSFNRLTFLFNWFGDSFSNLRMAENDLQKFNVTLFNRILMQLKEFSISGNQVENGHKIIQKIGRLLHFFDVSHSFVEKLNADTFQRFNQLWGLYLSQTNLTAFDNNPFENLAKLEYLDISNNNLNRLNATLLSTTLKQLQEFNISGNNVSLY